MSLKFQRLKKINTSVLKSSGMNRSVQSIRDYERAKSLQMPQMWGKYQTTFRCSSEPVLLSKVRFAEDKSS